MMTTFSRSWLYLAILTAAIFLLAGCGASPGTTFGGTGGTGADGGPWPTRPNRTTTPTTPATNAQPTVPLLITLHANAAADEELRINITKVELGYENDKWEPVATAETIAKYQPLPLRADAKGSYALLAKAPTPKRKYTSIRITTEGNLLVVDPEKAPIPLAIDVITLKLDDWTPAEKAALLTVTVNGAKVEKDNAQAKLPAEAIAVKTSIATGGIRGNIVTTTSTSVEVYWGATGKALLETKAAQGQDGAFAFSDLPPGTYHINVKANGYHLVEPNIKPITLADKVFSIGNLKLAEDNSH